MSWERTIEIVQRHTGTRFASNGKGGTKRESYTYYTTVESKTLNGVWPVVPQWPTMRSCSWLRSESYRNSESYLVRINSDAQRIRDYNPNINEYMTFTPKERVWITIFFWWCIWNVEPLKLEV
jgi:hypothetical protein